MLDICLQNDNDIPNVPSEQQLRLWITAALDKNGTPIENGEITIRIIDLTESALLNKSYRGKEGPTNVLSFSYDPDDYFTGDLAICADLVAQEALEQHKTLLAHWAHLTVHGTLHLMGHDHEIPLEAETMEALETQIMTALGFDDPYL